MAGNVGVFGESKYVVGRNNYEIDSGPRRNAEEELERVCATEKRKGNNCEERKNFPKMCNPRVQGKGPTPFTPFVLPATNGLPPIPFLLVEC